MDGKDAMAVLQTMAREECDAAKEAIRKGDLGEWRGRLARSLALLEAHEALGTEPAPCPDCHRKDGSKCKEGAAPPHESAPSMRREDVCACGCLRSLHHHGAGTCDGCECRLFEDPAP